MEEQKSNITTVDGNHLEKSFTFEQTIPDLHIWQLNSPTLCEMENKKQRNTEGSSDFKHPFLSPRWPPFSRWRAPCLATMAAVAKAQRRSGSMRPGGLGSTQLIQKLAQLAWYWWPPYSSLKLSVSELNAYESERVKYYYTPDPSVHSGDRRIDIEEKPLILLPLTTHNHNCLSTYQLFSNVNRQVCRYAIPEERTQLFLSASINRMLSLLNWIICKLID